MKSSTAADENSGVLASFLPAGLPAGAPCGYLGSTSRNAHSILATDSLMSCSWVASSVVLEPPAYLMTWRALRMWWFGNSAYAVADDFAFVLFIPDELIKQPPGRDTRNQSADEHQIAPRHAFSQQGKIKNKTEGGDDYNHHKSEQTRLTGPKGFPGRVDFSHNKIRITKNSRGKTKLTNLNHRLLYGD
jgi:hypothetical protein